LNIVFESLVHRFEIERHPDQPIKPASGKGLRVLW